MKHKHLITFGCVMVGAWVVGTILFIYFWPHVVSNHFQKSDRRSRVRRRPHPDQYALYRAAKTFCRSPAHIAASWKFEFDDCWGEPRHAAYSRLVGPQ